MKKKIEEILREIAVSGLNDGMDSEQLSPYTEDLIKKSIDKIIDIIEWS